MRSRLGLILPALLVAVVAACGGHSSEHVITLSFPFPLGPLSAEGNRVAAEPAGHNPQLGAAQTLPLVLWNLGSRKVVRIPLPRLCASPRDVSLAGSRVGVVCDESCCDSIDEWVAVLRSSVRPAIVFHAAGGEGVTGRDIGGLAGHGNLLVFNVEGLDAKGRVTRRMLFRIDGTHVREIAQGGRAGQPMAVVGGKIVVRAPGQVLRTLGRDGRQVAAIVSSYPASGLPAFIEQPLLFDGFTVYETDPWYGELEGEDARNGRISTPVDQIGRGSVLGGVSNGLVAYTTADAVHVIRMSDGRDVIFGLGEGVPVGADITPAGLFYAANARQIAVQDSRATIDRIHSRLTFVPMTLVRQALKRNAESFG